MRRHRRFSSRSIKKQRKLIILSVISFFLVFSVGYAAFQTVLTINVRGNIKKLVKASFGGLEVRTVTSGDGLYTDKDSDNNDIYVYKGADPDNYITLGEDLYRIMEIDKDGSIKVIKDTPFSLVWDPGYYSDISGITARASTAGTRYSSTSTDYCYTSSASSYVGCKSWGSKTSTLNSAGTSSVAQMPWEAGSSTLKTLPQYDSYLNVYLNGGTYPTTSGTTTLTSWYSSNVASSIQSKLISHLWNVGPVSSTSSYTLAQNIGQEASYKWSGKVGLMTATDYVRASTNPECTNVYNYSSNSSCYNNSSTHNWLYKNSIQWTMAPYSRSDADIVWYELNYSSGMLSGDRACNSKGVRPAFYLASCTQLSGKGTSGNPYEVSADDGSCQGDPTPPEPEVTYVYRWSTSSWTANQDISGMTEGTDYVTSASAVTNMDSRGANYYLKYKIENNIATESYLCFVTDAEHCLRGGDGAAYTDNVSVLTGQQSWFTGQNPAGICTLDPSGSDSSCYGGPFDEVSAHSDGTVFVAFNVPDYAGCYVSDDVQSYCS